MQLFYAYKIESKIAHLDPEEAKHCTKTLRKTVGDHLHFTDGKGKIYKGTIIETSKKSCSIRIEKEIITDDKRAFYIHIAIAPTKNIGRIELFLEKITEMGIDEISFLQCQRSERKNIRLDRLEKIVRSASKQSLKSYFPKINNLRKFKDLIKNKKAETKGFIAQCRDKDLPLLKSEGKNKQNVLILIGPEGDFSNEEINWAEENGFQSISLGKSRLRTETAGMLACHTIHLLNM